ncbi:alpha/beta hydrolase [Nocardioides marmoraquaticus]
MVVGCDGVDVATWEVGPPGDRPAVDVVLCHGTPWSAATWSPVARRLAVRHRVRLWDMPGYGASPSHPDLDLASQAARFARLLEQWDGPPPHVVAHDVGAAVALGAHLLHGRDLASLFLWDAVVLDPWGSPFFAHAAEHGDVLAALPAPLHRALVREYVSGAAVAPLPADRVDELVAPWLGHHGAQRFYRQVASLSPAHTRPLVPLLPDVRCPVRVGWGAQDPWLPVEQAARLREALPDGTEVEVVAAAGHLAMVERPDEVAAAVERWLTRTQDRASGG